MLCGLYSVTHSVAHVALMWSLAGRAGPAREEAAWEARPEKPITCLMDYPTIEQVKIHP